MRLSTKKCRFKERPRCNLDQEKWRTNYRHTIGCEAYCKKSSRDGNSKSFSVFVTKVDSDDFTCLENAASSHICLCNNYTQMSKSYIGKRCYELRWSRVVEAHRDCACCTRKMQINGKFEGAWSEERACCCQLARTRRNERHCDPEIALIL